MKESDGHRSLKRSLCFYSRRPAPPTSCSTSAKTRSASPPSLRPRPPPPSPRTTSHPRPSTAWTERLPASAWRRTDFYPFVFYTFHFILSQSCRFRLSRILSIILINGNLNLRLCAGSDGKREAGATLSGRCASIVGWECRFVWFFLCLCDELEETGWAGSGGFRDGATISLRRFSDDENWRNEVCAAARHH